MIELIIETISQNDNEIFNINKIYIRLYYLDRIFFKLFQ